MGLANSDSSAYFAEGRENLVNGSTHTLQEVGN